ncbi:MAG: type IV pilus secretin PilQ [Deltaproteobacteria bacterium]|jgi:type IV pilus assembly protein PilQ
MLTNPSRSATSLLIAGLLIGAPAAASANASGSVVIDRIETRDAAKGREVVIHTSKKPTFSVFRLSEPFRVLVDVNDARMKAGDDLTKVDDGVVRYVSTNQFADEASAVLRVEIALEERMPYAVRAEGNTIVVAIDAPDAKATPEPAVTAPTGAEPIELGKVVRRIKRGQAVLSAKLSGTLSPSAVHIEQLESPPRIVIDLAGATIEPKWQRVRVRRHGVKIARVAQKEGAVRFVLDVKQDARLPVVDVDVVKGRLQIGIQAAPKIAPAPVAKAAPAPAPTKVAEPEVEARVERTAEEPIVLTNAAPKAAPVAAAPAPKKAAKRAQHVSNVKDVQFEKKDGFVRLTMILDNDQAALAKDTSEGSVPVVRLVGASLPGNLERTLDVSQVAEDVVASISTYNENGDTIVAANIVPGTEHRQWRKGNRVMWDFRNRVATAKAETKVLPYGEQATSGYAAASTAVNLGAKLAPEKRRYTGRRISLDLKDADIQNVLRLLADVSKLNIVAAEDVKGKVTIKLRNVPWDQALDIILRSKQLDKTRNGNIIRVAPSEVLRREEELRIERAKARVELEPLSVRLIPVSYAVADEIQPQVSALLTNRGKVNIDKRTNVLIVEDIAEVLLKVERLVRNLDTQTPQVLIESRIVQARSNFSRSLGIQWGGSVNLQPNRGTQTGLAFPNSVRISGAADDLQNQVETGVNSPANYAINLPTAIGNGIGGGLGFVFGSAGGTALVTLRLSAAETQGKVKIISSPKIVTLDNKEAKILTGEKVPITVVTANGPTTRFIDANLELKVTPHVTQDGSVLLNVSATRNQIGDRVDNLGVPGIITNEAQTEMIVRDGDTAVLGGIYQRQAQENKSYVPWIGQIPVLGWFFKTTTRTDARDELLIFISPRIVNRSSALLDAG